MNEVNRHRLLHFASGRGLAALAVVIFFGGCDTSQSNTGVPLDSSNVEQVTETQPDPKDESVSGENGNGESGPTEEVGDGVRQITLHVSGMSERLDLF